MQLQRKKETGTVNYEMKMNGINRSIPQTKQTQIITTMHKIIKIKVNSLAVIESIKVITPKKFHCKDLKIIMKIKINIPI